MNIRKNRSGNWEIRQMIDGKLYQTTVKGKKPSDFEAMEIIRAMVAKDNMPDSISFRDAAKAYNKSRENIISPSTFREYSREIDRFPSWFLDLDIYEITQREMQKLANEVSVEHSAKTVHNRHGFAVSVIRFYRPEVAFHTTFKPSQRKEKYLPTKAQIDTILNETTEPEYRIALKLACYSLRRGEICALLRSDLTDDDQIHVCKALVQNDNKEWVVKEPKTPDSARYVPIDKDLASEIRSLENEQIFTKAPQRLTKYLHQMQKKLGYPSFSVHSLRHYYASTLHMAGIDDITIQRTGGWKNNSVLKSIYTHSDIQNNKAKQDKIRRTIK